jgi:sporulation-control protein
VQEFEFKPVSGPFRGKLDELEIVVFPLEEEAEVFVEIDRKARGLGSYLSEMAGTDEERLKFIFTEEDLPRLPEMIGELIESRL